MSFSFRKFELKSLLWKKVIKRTVLIFIIGLLLNWYPFFNKSLAELRYFGVLQRIALAYGGASVLVLLLNKRYLWVALLIILFSYWRLLLLGDLESPLSLENNLVRKIDLSLFGENHIYHGYGIPFDPEGLLSTIPAIGTAMVGYLCGMMLQRKNENHSRVKKLFLFGLTGILFGYMWHLIGFPINKPIWSSSYVLFAGGLAMVFLAILIWVIDMKGRKKWSFIFEVFGRNPLISYVLAGLIIKTVFLVRIGDTNPYGWIYQRIFQEFLGNYFGSFFQALTYTLFIWLFAFYLFRKGKVIKI